MVILCDLPVIYDLVWSYISLAITSVYLISSQLMQLFNEVINFLIIPSVLIIMHAANIVYIVSQQVLYTVSQQVLYIVSQ